MSHYPSFSLLVVSSALAHSTFSASIPLLPLILPFDSSVTDASYALVAFLVPSLFLHPLVSSPTVFPSLNLVLCISTFLQACGPLLLALALVYTRAIHQQDTLIRTFLVRFSIPVSSSIKRFCIATALFVAGVGTAATQSAIVRLLTDVMFPSSVQRSSQFVAFHLILLQASIALATIAAPLIFTYVASHALYIPFLVTALIQLLLASFLACTCTLPAKPAQQPVEQSNRPWQHTQISEADPLLFAHINSTYLAAAPTSSHSSKISQPFPDANLPEIQHRSNPGLLFVLRHPFVWLVLLSTVISAASYSFLRPVLTPYITDDLNYSRMFAASLFSLAALVGAVSESVAATFVSVRIGTRNTLMLGLLLCLSGFQLLRFSTWITAAVVLLVAGSSSSLVVALSEMSQVTSSDVSGVSNSIVQLAAFAFSLGEILGALGAGILHDQQGSFQGTVATWNKFLLAASVVVIAPCLYIKFVSYISSSIFWLSRRDEQIQPSSTTPQRPLRSEI